ncbi:MAG: DEAD/DEAH box helicase [Bacteroidia bacterium]
MNLNPILANFQIEELNEMQNATFNAFGKNADLQIISPTGSGKTLAFLLPLLTQLQPDREGVQAIIVVPTRELALQIEQVFKQMGTGFKINCCYGGHPMRIEKNNLSHPPAVLVGTPGRIADHLRKENIKLRDTETVILDEFDKSLEAGFQDEMEFIFYNLSGLKKKVLTSATALKQIPSFVAVKNLQVLDFTGNKKPVEDTLEVRMVRVQGDDKLEALMLLLGKLSGKSVIVFCNHREAVNRISEQLSKHRIPHGFYHGGLEQIDREKTLIKLRNGSTPILITTDLAARGLDIPEIEVVVHYQLPASLDVMIHRNGRTARMNAGGIAYFLLDIDDFLPEFIHVKPLEDSLPAVFRIPEAPQWRTLYFSAGKKDKINKMDIVGMLLQKAKLKKEELGKIEVLDFSAYAAVASSKIEETVNLVRDEKIKGKRVKIAIAN